MDENKKKRNRLSRLTPSEIITILVHFHQSQYRNFKSFYLLHVCQHLRSEFPDLLSYNRFIALVPTVFAPLCAYLQSQKANFDGIGFVDSTPIIVCHSKRIYGHKVFKGIAEIGKSTKGWFYGFKLHLVINEHGEILGFDITAGNVDDKNQKVIENITKGLWGKLFGDKGYISSPLFKRLHAKGIRLFTRVKKNMKNMLLTLEDKFLLSKRGIIESVNDILKNVCQIEHTRHRSPINFFVNLVAGLIAYSFRDGNPSLKINSDQRIACAK